jgi:hypothetical protein
MSRVWKFNPGHTVAQLVAPILCIPDRKGAAGIAFAIVTVTGHTGIEHNGVNKLAILQVVAPFAAHVIDVHLL